MKVFQPPKLSPNIVAGRVGLSAIKALSDKNGGRVRLTDPEEGEGAELEVILPIHRQGLKSVR